MHVRPRHDLVVDQSAQPDRTVLVGYAALIDALKVAVPWPDPVAVVSEDKVRADKDRNYALKGRHGVFRSDYAVEPSFAGHLTFALRHERLDLLALKRIFLAVAPDVMAGFVAEAPTSGARRQAWFLYEWLTGRTINVPAATMGNYVDAIDPAEWHTGAVTISARHRVRNNMPGTPAFCPLVSRRVSFGDDLRQAVEARLAASIGNVNGDQLRRLTRRLLLKDSKSTFLIENETPSANMAQRWSEVLAGAGKTPLDLELMLKLQKLLMSERRFVSTGLRRAGVFLGDRIDNNPVPVWIGAKPEDLQPLMEGVVAANRQMTEGNTDPLAQAAAIGFGTVFIHPFEDGNGRMHRYLLQHVLGERDITPKGVTLPISKAIWQDLDGYHEVLSSHDRPRMPLIEWRATDNGNVEVCNDTADFYRFFDASDQADYLIKCLNRVLDNDIPNELTEMDRRDRMIRKVRDIIDMPDALVEKFALLVTQNNGTLSKGKRKKEFPTLTDAEVTSLQELVREVYEIEIPAPSLPTP